MAKLLNGKELSLFIKEQQAREVRSLKQSKGVEPRLAIIRTNSNPATDMYVRLKQQYAEDIGVTVDIIDCAEDDLVSEIEKLNHDDRVHGIIVQLPLKNVDKTEEAVSLISPTKDVDGLGENAVYDAATPTAINWLLAGYNVELVGKIIVIVGNGRLVGAPLARIWKETGYNVTVLDENTPDKPEIIKTADILVSAVGSPRLINSEIVKDGAVVVDAGIATDRNELVGDLADDVRDREDIKITPVKGGVGPLTVAALFHNLLVAARNTAK